MKWSFQHSSRPAWPLILLTAALSLGLVAPAAAQPSATCNGLPATIVATAPGRIDGTDGVDVIVGTAGNDEIVGLRGDDTICGGDGNDTLVWNPGDGSDLMEGQAGQDTLLFNGAGANETIDISANGARLRFFRDVASITMDVDGTERVSFNALGGADTITVGDLSGTAVTQVSLSLAAALGGAAGDTQADSVSVNGTAGDDGRRGRHRRERPERRRQHQRQRGRPGQPDDQRPRRRRHDQRHDAPEHAVQAVPQRDRRRGHVEPSRD
jgi:hypothetical protein